MRHPRQSYRQLRDMRKEGRANLDQRKIENDAKYNVDLDVNSERIRRGGTWGEGEEKKYRDARMKYWLEKLGKTPSPEPGTDTTGKSGRKTPPPPGAAGTMVNNDDLW
jgi:hypothetical protein